MARRRFGNAPRINLAGGPGSSPGMSTSKMGSAAKALAERAAQALPAQIQPIVEDVVESGVHTKDRESYVASTNDAPDAKTLGGVLEGRAAFVGVRAEAPVIEAARALAQHRLRAVAVIDRASVVGVVTERSIVRRVVAVGRDPARVRCDDIMSGDVVIAYAADSIERGLRLLRESGNKHLIVIEGEDAAECRVLGLLTASELVERTFLAKEPEVTRISTPPPAPTTALARRPRSS